MLHVAAAGPPSGWINYLSCITFIHGGSWDLGPLGASGWATFSWGNMHSARTAGRITPAGTHMASIASERVNQGFCVCQRPWVPKAGWRAPFLRLHSLPGAPAGPFPARTALKRVIKYITFQSASFRRLQGPGQGGEGVARVPASSSGHVRPGQWPAEAPVGTAHHIPQPAIRAVTCNLRSPANGSLHWQPATK